MSRKRVGFRFVIITGVMVIFAAAQPLGQDPSRKAAPIGTIGPIRAVTPQAVQADGEVIEGTWIGEIVGLNVRTLTTYSRGGGLTSVLSAPQPTLRGALHGTWARTGFREFRVTRVRFSFDSAGNFAGTTKLRTLVTVNETFDRYSEQGIEERFDRDENLVFTRPLTFHARRMNAEPLP